MKRTINLITVLFLFLAGNLSAQEFSIRDLIMSAYDDPLVLAGRDQVDFLQTADMRTPNINEVELRGRSEDLNLSIEDVRMRLSFTNPSEIKEGVRYSDLLIDNYELEYRVRFHMALIHRYQLIMNYINKSSERSINNAYKLNLEDQIKLEKIEILNGSGQIDDLVQLEDDYTEVIMRESQLSNDLLQLEARIRSIYTFEGPVLLTSENIVSPTDITNLLDTYGEMTHPSLALKEQDVQLGLQETELEKRESKGDLGFFQAEYERNPDLGLTDNLGYQLGITLPITNADKANLEKNKLKNLKQRQKLELTKARQQLELNRLKEDLTYRIHQYQFISKQLEALANRNEALQTSYLTPYSLVKMQENELKLRKAINLRREDLLKTYLQWLDQSGVISTTPLRNYIYSTFPEVSGRP